MSRDVLTVPHKCNLEETHSGIDTLARCQNPDHFRNYPWPVAYNYNSRGYRDAEWPSDIKDLRSSVWCVGDSFTVGLGQPFDHIWPQILSKRINIPTINVSRDGASNGAIADNVRSIIKWCEPARIVVMWSYLHRRIDNIFDDPNMPRWKQWYDRIQQPGWPDCNSIAEFQALSQDLQSAVIHVIGEETYRRELTQTQHYVRSTNENDIEDFAHWVQDVELNKGHTHIVHSVIPEFCPVKWTDRAMAVIEPYDHVPHTPKLDLARDGHHFDRATAEWVVEQVVPLLRL